MASLTRKERKLQNSFVAVPWRNQSEYVDLKENLFSKDIIRVGAGINKVKIWMALQSNCPVQHVMEYTALFLEALALDAQMCESAGDGGAGSMEMMLRQNYCMLLIRFINGLLDPLQNSVYAIPLVKLCEKIGIPKYLVELRHQGTHERVLPSLEMSRFAVQNSLTWMKANYWDVESAEVAGDEEDENSDDDEDETELERTALQDRKRGKELAEFFSRHRELFQEYRGYFTKNIRRSTFDMDNGDKTEKRNRTLVLEYIQELKQYWKVLTAKERFVADVRESLEEDYGIYGEEKDYTGQEHLLLFLQLLFNKLDKFEFYFIKELSSTSDFFQHTGDTCNSIHSIIKLVDCGQFLSNYSALWHSNVKDLQILKQLVKSMQNSVNHKKWKDNQNYKLMVADLNELEKSPSSFESSTGADNNNKQKQKQKQLQQNQPNKRSLDSIDDILNDIQSLKKLKPNVKPSSKTNNNSKPVYKFEQPEKWEFKPFGVL